MSEPFFTLEEVARNNGVGEARTWIILKDVVYDVTDYLDEHPGGGELLSEYAGKDGTAAFDDFGHSSDAKNILKTYRIGQLDEKDKLSKKTHKTNGGTGKTSETKSKLDETRKHRRSFMRVVCGGCV